MKQKLFIIHGWTYDLDKWTGVCQVLKEQGFEPVQLKVPGLTTPSDTVWDIDGYVDWLDTELRQEADPIVIGHSNGGRIALSYVQRHPGRLKQLILIDSAGVPHAQVKSRAKLKLLRTMAAIAKPFIRTPALKRFFYKVIRAQDYFNAPPNMKLTMQNMLAADATIDLSAIKVPVTIIWGRDDAITPLADGQRLAAGIKGSKLQIIDEARHSPFANHPDEVAAIISKTVAGKSEA
jgi:pimeloyl-ACP methyl ester carboxylesterase